MKLRINAKLRAALIAAVAAVGFTTFGTGAAYSATLNQVVTMSDLMPYATTHGTVAESTTWEIVSTSGVLDNMVYDFSNSGYLTVAKNSALDDFFTTLGKITTDSSTYVTIAAWVNPTDHGGSLFSTGEQNTGFKLMDNEGSAKFTTKGAKDFDGAKASGIDKNPDTWQLVAVTIRNNGGNVQIYTMVDSNLSGKGDNTGPKAVTTEAFTIGNGNNDKAREAFSGSIAGLTVFTSTDWASTEDVKNAMCAAPTLITFASQTWDGNETNYSWSDTVWLNGGAGDHVAFNNGDAVFGATGHKTVLVNSDVTAHDVTVDASGKKYTFDLAHNLTTGSLSVAANSILALDGSGTMTVTGALTCNGMLEIASGATLKVTDAAQAKALMLSSGKVSNKGTVLIGGDVTFDSSATTTMGGTLAVAAGKKLTLGNNKDNLNYNLTSYSALVLENGANIDTKAKLVTIKNLTANNSVLNMLDTNDENTVGVDLQGTTNLVGNLTINSSWKYKINIDKLTGTGNLSLNGGAQNHRAVIGDADIHGIEVTDKMTETWLNGTVKLSDTLALKGGTTYAGADGSLTVGGLTGTAALTIANGITFTGTGNYTYSGTLTSTGGQIVKQGTGSQTISGTALYRAIDVQAGTLVLNGTYSIDAITDGETTDTYYDYEGVEGNNGFHLQSGSITVYTKAAEGATVDTTSAHFTYAQQDVTSAVIDDGIFEIPAGDPNYTTYHLNDAGASVDVATAYTYSKEALTTVNVNGATGTLTSDSAVSLAALNVASGSTATVAGAGMLSVTALNNEGTVIVTGNLALADPVNLSTSSSPIQVQSGGVLTIASNSKVDGTQIGSGTGTVEQTNGSFTKVFKGQALNVQDGGKLVLKGNVIVCDTQSGSGSATMVSGISELEIQGGFQINTYAVNPGTTWELGTHIMRATDYLWLTNHQFLTVAGGTVETGQLRLGHGDNTAGGSYPAKLTATNNSSIILGGIAMYGGHNEVNIDGSTLTFTKAEGNVLSQAKSQPSAAADLNKVVFNNTKLVADTSSWTLAPINGTTVTMTGANTIDVAEGKTVTLTVSTLNGAITKTGAGALAFTSTGESTLTDSIKVQQGALTLSGTYVIDNITAGSVVEKFVDTTGAENPNGGFYMQTGTKTVYSVAADIASINVDGAHFTYGGKDVTSSVVGGSYELPAEPIKTTLWVNAGELAYDDYYAASDGALATAKVAGGATLTVGATVVSTLEYQTNGSTITLAGAGTVNAISGTGILNMAAGAHVAVPSLTVGDNMGVYSTGSGTLVFENVTLNANASQIEFDSATEIGNLHMTGGSVTLGGSGNTHEVTNLRLSMDGQRTSTVNVAAGATLHITGTEIATKGGNGSFLLSHWNANNTVNVNGTLVSEAIISGWDGSTGTINVENGGTLELRAGLNRNDARDNTINVNVKEGATLVAGTANGGVDKDSLHINLAGGSTLKGYYGEGNTATIAKTLSFAAGTVTMDVEFGKTLQLDSNITTEGLTISKTGEGTLALNGNGNVLYNTIDLQAGNLALNGMFDVSHISHAQGTVEYYADPAGAATTNGFAKYTGEVQLVNANYGNVTVGENAVITLDGYAVGYNASTGRAGGTISLAAFYINEGTETLSAIQKIAPNAAVTLSDGAKLVADADLSVLTVRSGKGYVEIGQDATVQATAGAVELSGSGTYVLGSGASSLGATTLGETWTGAVKVTKNDLKDLNLNNFGQAGSVVEVDGWSKHLNNSDSSYTYNPKLRLGEGGLTIADGYSNKAYVFAGGVEGAGNFMYNIATSASNQTYAFTGDVSGWTGAYQSLMAEKTSTLQFYGSATEVNAAIQQTAGTINLVVGNGETEFATEFKAAVTASSITVNANASATFNELHITQAITSTGAVTLNQDLVVSGFTEHEGAAGYYDQAGVFSTSGNGYAGKDDSYITVVDGGSVTGNIRVTQDETTYGLLNSGNATLAGSGESTIDYSTFYVHTGSVNISDIAGAGHETSAIQVSNNGTLVVNVQTQGIAIDVKGTGIISGEAVNPTQVGIDTLATAKFDQPVEEEGVKFTAAQGETVNVSNMGDKATYSTENKLMNVQAQTLEMIDFEHDVTVSNTLWGLKEVVNETGHVLTLDNIDSLPLVSMTIGQGSTVKVGYTDQDAFVEGTVTITETLEAGGGTLLANLTIIGSTDEVGVAVTMLDLDGAGEKALTLGSTLTMSTDDGLIALDINTLSALEALGLGETLTLVKAYDQTTLTYGVDGQESYDGVWFDAMFSRVANFTGDYRVVADGTSFGLKKVSNTPEPTTGTLSLLALCALAARRRRH